MEVVKENHKKEMDEQWKEMDNLKATIQKLSIDLLCANAEKDKAMKTVESTKEEITKVKADFIDAASFYSMYARIETIEESIGGDPKWNLEQEKAKFEELFPGGKLGEWIEAEEENNAKDDGEKADDAASAQN